MRFIDIHTHHAAPQPHISCIVSSGTTAAPCNVPCSVGIHPWYIATAWEEDMREVCNAARRKNVVAIGECGIDKLKSPADITLQTEILASHARLAEECGKPLILHCVKAQEEIIRQHRSIAPKQAWIIHGFRGKPLQAQQLLHEGFYLSFGAQYNSDSLAITPIDRLFIESDTAPTSIEEIYRAVAACRGTSIEQLASSIVQNAIRCNINIL